MRRYAKALLLMFIALLYAGTAAAHTMTVTGPTSAFPTDNITVDVVLDTEGAQIYAYATNVYFDPAVLSVVSGVQNMLGGEGSVLITENPDNWYAQGTWWAASGPHVGSVMTLVFHVMDVPATTYTDIVPVTYIFDAGLGTIVPATGVPLSIHVPEPTTTMLMGLGLLGILYAGRRR